MTGRRPARVGLALAFGGALGAYMLGASAVLGEPFSARFSVVAALVAAAGALSGGAALVALRIMRRRPFTSRFALALLTGLAGVPVATALIVFLIGFPYWIFGAKLAHGTVLAIMVDYGAAAVYTVLATAMRVLHPFLVPAALAFAAVASGDPKARTPGNR